MSGFTPNEIKQLAVEIRNSIEDIDHEERQAEFEQWESETYEAKSEQLDAIRAEIDSARATLADVQERSKHAPVITQVLDFLDGTITHIVQPDGPVLIKTTEDALNAQDGHKRTLRMLSLLWSPKEGVVRPDWRINRYSDGSGFDSRAIPCRSFEDAQKIVRKMFDDDVALWRRSLKGPLNSSDRSSLKTRAYQWRPYLKSGAIPDESWPLDLLELIDSESMEAYEVEVSRAKKALDKVNDKKPEPFLAGNPKEVL